MAYARQETIEDDDDNLPEFSYKKQETRVLYQKLNTMSIKSTDLGNIEDKEI